MGTGPDWEAALAASRALQAKGGTREDVLFFLRRAGFGKVESIKALHQLEGLPIAKGKEAVHLSAVWSDRYRADEAFHDELEAALKQLGEQE
ncbi:hypothetical protein GO986_01465 [Deinococcus sp. HMF7620]|uniref:Uncharacterized protein n=1 Tax=Deinococcus arboris TaxID=2682977 RepID=A0A7C9HPT5_9DEIO|nr:hypothetical protein [Deinococcus arboris]